MSVLVAWPPHLPSYFNAGHHLPTFMITGYLRRHGYDVEVLDAGALNCTWKEFGDRLYQGNYQFVVIINEYDVVEGMRRAVDYTRAILPSAKIITVGRLSYEIPEYFRKVGVDAIVRSGDYESGVLLSIRAMESTEKTVAVRGVDMRTDVGWVEANGPGAWLPPESWVLPDVNDIPYESYERLYVNDANRFCGIPERRELVVPVARGCPVNCDFCDVPGMQGLKERRLSVAATMDYIRQAFSLQRFEYVAFYAPTFTLDKKWVYELCAEMGKGGSRYSWKCATTIHHLNEPLVAAMAKAGCVRISVGVETLENAADKQLPRVKQSAHGKFKNLASWCREYRVELNCFVIVGLPGTSEEGTRNTMEAIEVEGARARPTVYTPYHLMSANMSEQELSQFNRQTFFDDNPNDTEEHQSRELLGMVFGRTTYQTSATARVSSKRDHQNGE